MDAQVHHHADYMHGILGFPNATHDDQADNTSQALRYLTFAPKPRATPRNDLYGPSGRRTRASFNRKTGEPEAPTLQDTYEVLEPVAPRIRREPASYEPKPEGAWRPRS